MMTMQMIPKPIYRAFGLLRMFGSNVSYPVSMIDDSNDSNNNNNNNNFNKNENIDNINVNNNNDNDNSNNNNNNNSTVTVYALKNGNYNPFNYSEFSIFMANWNFYGQNIESQDIMLQFTFNVCNHCILFCFVLFCFVLFLVCSLMFERLSPKKIKKVYKPKN